MHMLAIFLKYMMVGFSSLHSSWRDKSNRSKTVHLEENGHLTTRQKFKIHHDKEFGPTSSISIIYIVQDRVCNRYNTRDIIQYKWALMPNAGIVQNVTCWMAS